MPCDSNGVATAEMLAHMTIIIVTRGVLNCFFIILLLAIIKE